MGLAIIALLVFPLLITYRTSRANQALRSSAQILSDTIMSAHVYARNARGEKSWGVRRSGVSTYELISKDSSAIAKEASFSLEQNIVFQNDFTVWFTAGVGDAESPLTIVISADNGRSLQVAVTKTGLVEVRNPS